MFTLEQIKAAHAKVKTGADFPQYAKDLIGLGVLYYDTDVADGHNKYCGREGEPVSSPAAYAKQDIATTADAEAFERDLKAHQEGKTDFQQFCIDCAKSGIARWTVDFMKMTCTYFDVAGNTILTEAIGL